MIRLKVYIATSSPLYWLLSLELRCKQKIGVLYNLWACLGSMSFLRKEHWARVTLTLIYHVYSCTMVVLGKEQVMGDMRLYYKWPSIMDWTLVHGRFTRVCYSSNVDTLDVLKNMHATIQVAIFLFILQLLIRFFFSLNSNHVLMPSYPNICPIVYYTQRA